MKIFFWLCLSLLIPGLLFRIGFGGGGILGTDIFVPLFVSFWLGKKILTNESFPKNRFLVSGFLFVAITVLSFLFGAWDLELKEQVISFSFIVRLATLLLFGWAATDIYQTIFFARSNASSVNYLAKFNAHDQSAFQKQIEYFFRGLFLLVFFVIILGFLQFYLVPDISKYSTEGGWDPHTGRLLGTWMDPNFVAGFLGFIVPLMFGKWYDSASWKERSWLGGLILLCLYALFLTFSRSGYLSSSIGLLLFFLFRDPKIILIGILAAGMGIMANERAQKRVTELAGTISSVVFQDTDEIDPTAKLRIVSWKKSFDLFVKYPVLGIGYNTYRYRAAEEGIVDENYHSAGGSDSTHLTVLVTTGAIGALFFIFFVSTLFFLNFGRYFTYLPPFVGEDKTSHYLQAKRKAIFLGFAGGFLSLFFHAVFVNSLFFPLIFMVVMAVAGVLEAIHNGPQRKHFAKKPVISDMKILDTHE